MSSRKKQTYAQQAVGLATMGLPLPSPVQKFLTSRMGALLFVVAVPALIATGVITVTFNNGMPSVQFNQQRAAVVEQQVQAQALQAAQAAENYRAQRQQQNSVR